MVNNNSQKRDLKHIVHSWMEVSDYKYGSNISNPEYGVIFIVFSSQRAYSVAQESPPVSMNWVSASYFTTYKKRKNFRAEQEQSFWNSSGKLLFSWETDGTINLENFQITVHLLRGLLGADYSH